MAISGMKKIMIASYRTETGDLLERLQQAGIVELLNAEQAVVTKQWPELQSEVSRPRDMQEMVDRLGKAIDFLEQWSQEKKTSLFAPRVEVDGENYSRVVSGREAVELLEQTEKYAGQIETEQNHIQDLQGMINYLQNWSNLEIPLEALREIETNQCIAGLVSHQHYDDFKEELTEKGAIVEHIGSSGSHHACLVVFFSDKSAEIHKALRGYDFDIANFENLSGTVAENISSREQELEKSEEKISLAREQVKKLASERLKLQILFDHYQNLLGRETVRKSAPATENVVLLEGWVKSRDFKKLEMIVGDFESSDVSEIEPGEGEEKPVDIENSGAVKPFEFITRLYGMPKPYDVDPTVFLAPFFALFFGICLTDAAYGIIMLVFLLWLVKKVTGDKKFLLMMSICSVTAVVAGALTGGWFGDSIQVFLGEDSGLNKLRQSLMWFDPLEKPMYFFSISLALGYLQIIFGIGISFFHKLSKKEYSSAVFDHLSWFVWLNSLVVFGFAKAGFIPAVLGKAAGFAAIVPAAAILLFSEREGNWGYRVGMGFYNLFSTVFYLGDVLSYIRLMALGMVTGGFGMAINEITRSLMEVPYAGFVLAGLVFVAGHLFNIANSALSAFVHTMRLQFVEFFTKFLAGGGKEFEPLTKSYKHINLSE